MGRINWTRSREHWHWSQIAVGFIRPSRYRVNSGLNLWANNHAFFQKISNNYKNNFSRGIRHLILDKNRARKCRNSKCKVESAKPRVEKSGKPESQKSTIPGIQWLIMCSRERSSEPESVFRSAREPVSQSASGVVYRKWNKLCICQR